MLVSSYTNGFGAAQAPTLAQLLYVAVQRERSMGSRRRGLGADLTNWEQFKSTRAATYHNAANDPVPGTPAAAVWCKKNAANNPECQLMSHTVASGRASSGPVAAMQRAADRIMNAIPAYQLSGRQMKAPTPTGDGTTSSINTFTIVDNGRDPIGSRAGYDGVVGPNALGFINQALVLAGMLKTVPNAVALPFVSPSREDITTLYAGDIAAYLNDVADRFPELLAAYNERGTPASTPLDTTTIPAVVPLVTKESRLGPIIVGAAAMIGLTTIAAVASGKQKPGFMYEPAPALGRRSHRGKLRPRGW